MHKIIVFCLPVIFYFNSFGQLAETHTDSIISGGLSRHYRIYVPDIYESSTAVPLLLNLHGYGSNAFQQEIYGEFRNIADTANFIMVLPEGTTDGIGFQFWNCFQPDNIGVDDVQFISDLIDSVSLDYNIDFNRIYSTGMSNGGFMSYSLAGELSERIAAIASVTGSISDVRLPAILPTHPVPIMEIHGTADGTVPYNGSGSFLPVEDVIDFWVGINNCNPTPEVIEVPDIVAGDGCTATHFIYSGGTNDANVELFRINGGGHTWPGTIFLVGVTNKDINASLEIWRFFIRYRLDVLTETQDISNPENVTVQIYPNPVNSLLNIETNANQSIENITVYDLTGRRVIDLNNVGQHHLIINTANLVSGIYTISFQINGKVISDKIVKH